MSAPAEPADRGAVTVEAAIAVCTVVVVLTAAVTAVLATAAYLRCVDAAREGARLVARGELERARPVAAQLAPRGADVSIAVHGDEVRVEVSTAAFAGWEAVPRLSASAVAVLEPGAGEQTASEPSGAPAAASEPSGAPAAPFEPSGGPAAPSEPPP